MAYNALNNLIDAYIYANGVQAITGQILNGVLKQMVSQLGSGYHLMGVAGPETVPASNDYAMAYFAATAGEYTDFGGITLSAGEVAVLLTSGNGSWSKQTIYNVPTTTEDLENTAGFITNAVTDLVNYYTKTEVDDTLANYPTLEALATALADYYTKTEIDTTLEGYPTKQDQETALGDYYTKDEMDAALGDRYTKDETDTKLADYYKKTETYDKDEVDSIVAALSRQEYIVAWDGLTAPDVSAIPAGVTVIYSGTTYTGTLAASASTVNKIYMVWNGIAYDMYGTSQDGGFSWVPMGTTTVDLSQYATKGEVSQLEAKLTDFENEMDYLVDSKKTFTEATNGTYYHAYPIVAGHTYKLTTSGSLMSVNLSKEQSMADAEHIADPVIGETITFTADDNYAYIAIYKGSTTTGISSTITINDTGDIKSYIESSIESQENPLDEKVSVNILRLDNLVPNTYINNTNGVESPYTNWSSSPYIEIEGPNTYEYLLANSQGQYSRGNSCYWACYDAGKTFIIGGTTNQSTPMPVPANAMYIRVSFGNNQLSQVPMVVAQADYTQGMSYQEPSDNTYREEILGTSEDIIVPKAMAESVQQIRIVAPSSFALIQNKAMDMLYDNVVFGADATKFSFCNGGGSVTNIMRERLRFLSTQGVTTYAHVIMQPFGSLSSKTQDAAFSLRKRFTANVIPATAGSGVTKKVMFIGDSITANGKYPREVRALFADDEMSVNLIGTLGYGGVFNGGDGKVYNSNGQVVVDGFTFNENGEVVSNATGQVVKDNSGDNMTFYHEGRGGWSAKKYCTETTHNGYVNAFWNPSSNKFDFSYYMTKYGFTGVDYVFINLGINDLVEYNNLATDANLAEIVSYYDEIIASIKAYNASAKILIGLCILPANYEFSTQTNIGEHAKTSRLALHEKLIAEYEGTHLIVPLNFPIDSHRDFPSTMLPVCDRDETLVPYCTDNVHPANQGYYKIADVCHTYIKYQAAL